MVFTQMAQKGWTITPYAGEAVADVRRLAGASGGTHLRQPTPHVEEGELLQPSPLMRARGWMRSGSYWMGRPLSSLRLRR